MQEHKHDGAAPPLDIVIRRAHADDRLVLYRMLELYQYDLSDVWEQDLDAHGEYGYALDRYWSKHDCHPFVAMVAGRYAGFALVDRAIKVGVDGHWMDQFFILKKYRLQGVGLALASYVFAALPGSWEVGQMTGNLPAHSFWRSVIAGCAADGFEEHVLTGGWWEGIVQCFDISP